MRNLVRLRQLTGSEERALADQVAMTIARLKEHIAAHGCERPWGSLRVRDCHLERIR